MLSVSQIARRCGLSRTTILYYEACGLLKPALRSAAGYRCYGEREVQMLEQICLYRSVGLSVKDVRLLLSAPQDKVTTLLKGRLRDIDFQIRELKNHQQVILRLLCSKDIPKRRKTMTKEKWVAIMKSAGLTEDDMHRWHREFERSAPQDHAEFLRFLHIPESEIRSICEWSRTPADPSH